MVSSPMICPNGHQVSSVNSKFCTTCGATLQRLCINGHASSLTSRFCTVCGTGMDAPDAGSAVNRQAATGAPKNPSDTATESVSDLESQSAVPEPEQRPGSDRTTAVVPTPPVRVPVTGQLPVVPTAARPTGGSRSDSGRRLTVLVVALAAIVLVGAAVGVTYAVTSKNSHGEGSVTTTSRPHSTSTSVNSVKSTGTTEQTTTTTSPDVERSAAVALSSLLSQSVADRSEINAASEDVAACGSTLEKDASTFQAAAASRQSLLSQLTALPGSSSLPPQLIQTLTSAWNASEQVDDDYAQWASSEEAGGCTPGGTTNPYFQAAETPNTQATQAKQSVANIWNPVAQTYNLPTYQWDQL